MNEKLVMAEARYDEISAKLSDPAVIADNKLYRDLMREHKNLTPLMEVWQKYKKAQRGFDDAVEALNEAGGDAELRELAQSEYDENKAAMEKLSEELKILLLPKDPDDDRSCIIEIRAGAGGEEAALFANSLLRMYSMYAARQGWKVEELDSNPTELGGYREVSFLVEGEGVFAKMKYESGVHRVQRVPETESQGRIQTSTVTVAVLPEADALYRRLEELLPELEDISSEAASMAFGADDNEEREADLEDRVSAMKHACRKYNMDPDQLVDYLGECRQELSQLSGLDGEIERLSEEKHELAGQVKRMAEDISAKRREASEKLSAEICEVLRFLNMPNVTLTFDVRPDKITINGMDEVEILISANAGEEPKPLNKTASGGELSRVMLAVKSVMAEGDDIPTMIFDEVDAGISGRTAAKVGIKLAETARKRQVLCITHLAQIAALAQTHMLIEKQTDDKRTYTRIVPLDHEGRKQELARIMDGGLTESGLKAAEEMLSRQVE